MQLQVFKKYYFILFITSIFLYGKIPKVLAATYSATPESINSILSNSHPGDTIQLRAGKYNSILLAKPGLTLTNYPNEIAIFDGSSASTPQAVSPQILVVASDINIRGNIKLLNSPEMGVFITDTSQNIVVDGIEIGYTKGHGIASRGKNVTIKNIFVHDGVLENQAKNMNGGWASCIKGERDADGLYISNNTVERCYGEAIAVTMTNNSVIQNNTIRSSWAVGIYLDNVSNIVVDKNFITCSDSQYWRNSTGSPSIAGHTETYSGWSNRFNNISIKNNIVVGCDGFAYWGDQTRPTNTLVANNTFVNTNNVGTYIEGNGVGITYKNNITKNAPNLPSGVVYSNNHLITNDTFLTTPSTSDPETTKLKNNIIGTNVDISDDFGGNLRTNPPTVGAWQYVPAPTTTNKPGDLNNDSLVNIFDYNLLLSSFNNLYNIFDFNNIVANYSK